MWSYESKGRGFESRRAHQTRSPPFTGGDFVCMNRADSKPRPVREWGKGLTTAGGGYIVSAFLSRNKRSPLWGVAPIEAADESRRAHQTGSVENKRFPVFLSIRIAASQAAWVLFWVLLHFE